MLGNEKCPHCGSNDGLFSCSFMAVNCANCGQFVRLLTKRGKRKGYRNEEEENMKYQEAVEEMKVLAKGEYWTIDHQTDPHGVRIRGYVVPFGHAIVAATYHEATENVRRMLGLAGSDPAPEDGEEGKYQELIMAVGNKYPRESRHDTALRYITEAENRSCAGSACDAKAAAEIPPILKPGEIPVLKPITTPVRDLDPALIEETMTKANEEYQRRGE